MLYDSFLAYRADLVRALSRPLSSRLGPWLTVESIELEPAIDDWMLTLIVVDINGQRWCLELGELGEDGLLLYDLSSNMNTFVTIVRANMEEWWDCKDYEPHTAKLGRKI